MFIAAPPEGYELIPAETDDPQEPTRFRAPDGEIVTHEELVLAGLMPA
jgi:hypothetical protein